MQTKLTGTFDNRTTMRREFYWEDEKPYKSFSSDFCDTTEAANWLIKCWGFYPDIPREEGDDN